MGADDGTADNSMKSVLRLHEMVLDSKSLSHSPIAGCEAKLNKPIYQTVLSGHGAPSYPKRPTNSTCEPMQPSGSQSGNRLHCHRAALNRGPPATPEIGRDSTLREAERRKEREREEKFECQNGVLFARIHKYLRVVDILDVPFALST